MDSKEQKNPIILIGVIFPLLRNRVKERCRYIFPTEVGLQMKALFLDLQNKTTRAKTTQDPSVCMSFYQQFEHLTAQIDHRK